MPTPLPKSLPCLEIRINSVEDARREVRYAGRTFRRVNAFGLAGVEIVIAKEVEAAVRPLIAGVFHVKTYVSIIDPRGTNRFFPSDDESTVAKVEDKRVIEKPKAEPVTFAEKAATVSVTGVSGATPEEAKPIEISEGISVIPRKKAPIKTERLSDAAAQTLFASQPAPA